MKIGLLGGSFNPPHQGHLHISNLALTKLALNQIWWIPTRKNPFKDESSYSSYENRIEKCNSLIKNHPKIRIRKMDEIYTEKLITKLKNRYKNIEFFWIMGADNFENFHRWKNFKKLIKLIPFMVFSRDSYLMKIKSSKAFHLIKKDNIRIFATKKIKLSSSQIRSNV